MYTRRGTMTKEYGQFLTVQIIDVTHDEEMNQFLVSRESRSGDGV